MEISWKTREREKAVSNGKMEENMKVSGKQESSTEKEFIGIPREKLGKGSGLKAKGLSGSKRLERALSHNDPFSYQKHFFICFFWL